MEKITLSPDLLAHIQDAHCQVEVCDESGKTVGFFLPTELHRELLYAWVKSQFSDEEAAAARAERKTQPGYNTLDAIAHLNRLSGSAAGE